MYNNFEYNITKEVILSKVSEEEIFKYYLGFEPSTVGSYVNKLRGDDDPGCSFYVNPKGVWKFNDFAGGFNWDCFNVVQYAYNCSFKEALLYIARDFNLIKGDKTILNYPAPIKREKPGMRIKSRSWTNADYEIWRQWGIREERLDFFYVKPLEKAWWVREGKLEVSYFYTKNDPAYAYDFGNDQYQIYMPFRERGKRHLLVNTKIIMGYEQLPETATNLCITKSFKDVMVFDIFSREFDLYAIAPASETILLSLEAFKNLYNRFDNIGTLFDFDRAGIRLMRKYEKEYQLPFRMFGKSYKLQNIKDISDHNLIKGEDATRRLIESELKK